MPTPTPTRQTCTASFSLGLPSWHPCGPFPTMVSCQSYEEADPTHLHMQGRSLSIRKAMQQATQYNAQQTDVYNTCTRLHACTSSPPTKPNKPPAFPAPSKYPLKAPGTPSSGPPHVQYDQPHSSDLPRTQLHSAHEGCGARCYRLEPPAGPPACRPPTRGLSHTSHVLAVRSVLL